MMTKKIEGMKEWEGKRKGEILVTLTPVIFVFITGVSIWDWAAAVVGVVVVVEKSRRRGCR